MSQSTDGRIALSADDGGTYIHNDVIDQLMPIVDGSTFKLLFTLLRHVAETRSSDVQVSVHSLQHESVLRLSRASIIAALRELRQLGIIEVLRRGTRGGPAVYRVHSPENWNHRIVSERLEHHHSTFQHAQRMRTDSRWKAIRQAIFERDAFTCQYCRRTGIELVVDHVVPVSKGGTNDLSNLVAACVACNSSKHAKTLEEWLA